MRSRARGDTCGELDPILSRIPDIDAEPFTCSKCVAKYAATEPEKAAPEPPKSDPRAKLPRHDFYLQEAEDQLARKVGRANAETLVDWDE